MREKGIISKQLYGDLYIYVRWRVVNGMILKLSDKTEETNIPFILHRFHPEHGESIEVKDFGFLDVVIQADW